MTKTLPTTANNQRVTLTIDKQGIALVTLNRPDKYNALDMAMFKAIDNITKQLAKNKKIRAVIVQGQGENFCTGLDVKAVMSNKIHALRLLFKWWPTQANLAQRVSTAWRNIPAPVIFAIHGKCWGGGLQIALGGDFRIATADSNLSIMEAKWGLIPDMGGTLAFKTLLKQDSVMELAMTAKQITGIEAKELGLVSHISEQPLTAAYQLAEQIIHHSPDAIAATKKLFYKSWWSSSGMSLLRESYYQIKVLLGKNQNIAIKRAKPDANELIPFKPRKFK